jgi:hypothetical protein
MTTEYKSHTIIIQVTEEGVRWNCRLAVEWTEAGDFRAEPFTIGETFASQHNAESWALEFAKKWIDDGKPNLQKS